MNFPDNPRVVITGGGSGLGRAIAIDMAKRKARVLIADLNLEGGAETVKMVESYGSDAAFIKCDVSKPEEVEALADEMERLWGGTDILVNNAGVAAGGLMGEQSLQDWEWIMRINLWGVIYGCHYFVPRMKKQGRGFILNVASAAGLASTPEMAAYNVTKHGVIGLSETLFTELSRFNINVTVLCPTFFKTNLMDSFRAPDERQHALAHAFFARSSMTAEEVAEEGLRGLERHKLFVVPQRDGKMIWRTKRFSPQFYFKRVIGVYNSGVFDRLVASGRKHLRR